MQKQEDVATLNCSLQDLQAAEANDTQTLSCPATTAQQASSVGSSEQCSGGPRELCQSIMAKAYSLNEVSSRDLDPAADVARISLDAESGPAANRRRRKRYSPSSNSAQKVSINVDNNANDNATAVAATTTAVV